MVNDKLIRRYRAVGCAVINEQYSYTTKPESSESRANSELAQISETIIQHISWRCC